ncbi:hypothetical protein ACMFMG_006119 [Clarireedia jacksonii]
MEVVGRRAMCAGLKSRGVLCLQNIQRNSPPACRKLSTTLFRAAKSKPQTTKKIPKARPEYRTPTPGRKLNDAEPTPPPPPPEFSWYRKVPLIGAGIVILMIAGAGSYVYVLSKNVATESPISPATQEDVSSRYNSIASKFDSEIETTEYWTGITKARKKMIAEASGDVLEVSIGTGRNLDYYDWDFKGFNGVGKISQDPRMGIKRGKVKSFTAVDKSAEMLEVAHEKFSAMFPGVIGVRWIVQDAAEPIPGPPRNANERSGNKDAKYDTVVQTMGLCSVNDPVALLKNLGECVKEEEGRILLLEHGRGSWAWVNRLLDGSAQSHATRWGCWWNRDLEEIVKDSGLEIVKMERWHFGTNSRFELKKPKTTTLIKERAEAVKQEIQKQEEKVEKIVQKKGWW